MCDENMEIIEAQPGQHVQTQLKTSRRNGSVSAAKKDDAVKL